MFQNIFGKFVHVQLKVIVNLVNIPGILFIFSIKSVYTYHTQWSEETGSITLFKEKRDYLLQIIC